MYSLTIVPPASIRSFERQLLSTTALTPTHHKGGIGKVLGIVAAVAIPFAAPAIATSIGISAALGPTLGSALVGAGLGAASSLITGQNPLMGAVMGGIGGGVGGYMQTPSHINPWTGSTIHSTVPFGGPDVGGAEFMAAQGMPSSVGVQTVAPSSTLPSGSFEADAVAGQTAGLSDSVGSQLSGGVQPANYSSTMTPREWAASQNWPMDENFNYIDPNTGAKIPTSTTAYGQRIVPRLGGGVPPTAMAQAQPSVLDSVTAGIRGLPSYVKDAAGKLVTQGASTLFAEKPAITPGEQAALDQRARIMQMEEDEQARKRALGDQYMQQARAINPVNYGMESAADAAARLQRGQQAGLRNLTGAQRTAALRRAALDQARVVNSAFSQGYGRGLETRMANVSRAANTGVNIAPLYNMASNDLGAAQTYQQRLNQERANAAGIIDPLVTGGLFGLTDAEREAQAKRIKDKQKTIQGASV